MQAGLAAISCRDQTRALGGLRAALGRVGVEEPTLRRHGRCVVAVWGGIDAGHEGLALLSRGARRHERDLSRHDVAALLDGRDGAALGEVLPPFAAVRLHPSGDVVAATDALGFRHVYRSAWDGAAAISTSARLLAVLGGSALDTEALSLQSVLGWQVGDATPYVGVRKLGAGQLVRLGPGRLDVTGGVPGDEPRLGLDEAVDSAAAMLRTHLATYVTQHPDAVLQLTGGQDSRILLSAVPPDLRRGLRAVTLAVPGSEDAAIAADLARRTGVDHEVVALRGLGDIDPEEAFALCAEASVRLEAMADPVALAALSVAERQLDQGHRIAGLGGEIARGFYYVGRQRRVPVTRARVDRLTAWRMFVNESVQPEALAASLRDDARERAADRIHGLMAATGKDWFAATDDFYLYQRMQRWAGVTDTAVCLDRSVVNPMLDDRFVAIAQGLAPEDKAGALFLARLQMALDPVLGGLPLDGRPPPAAYAERNMANRVRAARTLGHKAARKVRQRLSRSARPPAGGDLLADKVVQWWRLRPELVEPARASGLLDDAWLDAVLRGEAQARPSTVALVLNLATVAGARQPRAGRPASVEQVLRQHGQHAQ